MVLGNKRDILSAWADLFTWCTLQLIDNSDCLITICHNSKWSWAIYFIPETISAPERNVQPVLPKMAAPTTRSKMAPQTTRSKMAAPTTLQKWLHQLHVQNDYTNYTFKNCQTKMF